MRQKFTLILFIQIIFACLFVQKVNSENLTIFLTSDIKRKIHVNEFDCRQKIYIYAELRDLKEGSHAAEAHWKNPKDKLQQVSRHQFTTKSKDYNIWLWLKLHPSTGGKLFGDLDPSFGMGEFFGNWSVKLYLNDELVATKAFYVVC
jgi:hypothetical protein